MTYAACLVAMFSLRVPEDYKVWELREATRLCWETLNKSQPFYDSMPDAVVNVLLGMEAIFSDIEEVLYGKYLPIPW